MTSEKDLAVATTTVATDFTSLSAEPANKNPDTLSKVSPTKKDNRKLFVGGIARNLSDKAFREFFEQYGSVVDSIVMLDRVSKTGRGFGFVTFEDENVAKQLLSSGSNKGVPSPPEGHTSCKLMIHGRMCEVKVSEPKKIESQSNLSSQSSLTVPEQIQFQNGTTPSDAVYQAGYVYPQQQPMMYPTQDFTSSYQYYYPMTTTTAAGTTATQVGYNNNYYQCSPEQQGVAYYPQDAYYYSYYPSQYYQWSDFGPGFPTFVPNNNAHYDSQQLYEPNDSTITGTTSKPEIEQQNHK
jgi:RNA-binding protein Musashi